MANLLIENYNIIVNANNNEYWNLYTVDSNFMLSKYSGKGSDTIKMIKYSDVDDYQGSVKLIINGNKCILPSDVNESDISVANDNMFFVIPTLYSFNEQKGESFLYSGFNSYHDETDYIYIRYVRPSDGKEFLDFNVLANTFIDVSQPDIVVKEGKKYARYSYSIKPGATMESIGGILSLPRDYGYINFRVKDSSGNILGFNRYYVKIL